MNLVDTSAWIEYFFSGPNASHFAKPIEQTDDLIVSVICLYEVFKKINLVADEAQALRSVAQMKHGRVVDVTEDVALSAALISIQHKLPMANSLIYATAKTHGATVWTQDVGFKHLPNVNYREAGRVATR